jgi:hypothetical protein
MWQVLLSVIAWCSESRGNRCEFNDSSPLLPVEKQFVWFELR